MFGRSWAEIFFSKASFLSHCCSCFGSINTTTRTLTWDRTPRIIFRASTNAFYAIADIILINIQYVHPGPIHSHNRVPVLLNGLTIVPLSRTLPDIHSLPMSTTQTYLGQPDISYHPDESKFKERTARRLAEDPSLPNTPLPSRYPKKVTGPIVWEGKDWTKEDQWVYHLSPEELQEINAGLVHFKGSVSSDLFDEEPSFMPPDRS